MQIMMVEIPQHLRSAVNEMPEHSYGVTRVVITLKDGREIPDVRIGWGVDVLKIGNSAEIPFSTEDVIAVRHQA
jgi:hypothetical protein